MRDLRIRKQQDLSVPNLTGVLCPRHHPVESGCILSCIEWSGSSRSIRRQSDSQEWQAKHRRAVDGV